MKEIPKGEAVVCIACRKKPLKTFHKDCFEKHNMEERSGKAKAKSLKELDSNICAVKVGNKIIKL